MLIALACGGVGVQATWRLCESERLWQAWVRLLTQLYTELRYTVRPVQEVFASLDKKHYRALAWLSEYDGVSQGVGCPQGLCAEERAFAESFFAFVGTSDLEGQLAHIAQYGERAKDTLARVAEKRQRLSKVYISTAVCIGLSAAIVMV